MLPASFTDQARVEIARVIGERTLRLAELFAHATEFFPRWASAAAGESNRAEYLKREFEVLPIYLREYFSANDDSFLALFVGERIKAFYDPAISDYERREITKRICASEREAVENCLKSSLAPPQLDLVLHKCADQITAELGQIVRVVVKAIVGEIRMAVTDTRDQIVLASHFEVVLKVQVINVLPVGRLVYPVQLGVEGLKRSLRAIGEGVIPAACKIGRVRRDGGVERLGLKAQVRQNR